MVLPLRVKCAARRGDRAVVAAWLESGGSINEVDTKNGRTLLLLATIGPATNADEHCDFDERHVALARLLVERGADVNLTSANRSTPLHYTSYGRSESGPAMVALLLKAGANVLVTNSRRHTPLTLVLTHLAKHGPSESRTGMEIALLLLRAIPSLDHARTGAVTGTVYSAEETLDWAEECGRAHAQANPPLSPNNCIDALKAVVAGVRAAGGWRAYDRKPRAEVLRLRSLALRRRAVLPRATRHNGPNMRSLDFLVRCPPEIAWQILGYWRCQYAAETDMIDQLGYR